MSGHMLNGGKPLPKFSSENYKQLLRQKIGGGLIPSNSVHLAWALRGGMTMGKWNFFYYGPG